MRQLLKALASAALAVVFIGCADDEGKIRVIHASTGAPPVDVYVQGRSDPIVSDLSYGEVSSNEDLEVGDYILEVRPAGADSSSAPLFTSEAFTLSEDDRWTVVAMGTVGQTAAAQAFRLLALRSEFGNEEGGRARMRIVHASLDAPAVDLDLAADGTVEAAGLQRFAASPAEGLLIPANEELQMALLVGGARVTTFTLPEVDSEDELYLVIAGRTSANPITDEGLVAILANEDERMAVVRQNPILYTLHASPDAPAVDIYSLDRELVENLQFGQLSGRIQLRPGTHPLAVFPFQAGATRPTGTPAATAATPNLEAGRMYLLGAAGFLSPATGEPAFRIESYTSGFVADAQNTRVRAVHLAPDAPAVDVGTVTGTTFTPIQGLTNLTFPNASAAEGAVIPPGTSTLAIAPQGTTTPVARFNVPLQAGTAVWAVAAGSLAPTGTRQGLRLIAIEASTPVWTATTPPPL